MKRLWSLLCGISLVGAACGGGGSSHATSGSSAQSVTTASPSGATTTTPGGSTSATTTASTAQVAPTTSEAAPSAPPPTVPAPTVAGSTNRPGSNSAQPAAPGLYRYRQSGSSTFGSTTKPVPTEGTLRIDPIGSDGNQVEHRTTDPSAPPSDTTFAFRNGGVYLVQIVLRSNAGGHTQTFTCNFSPPMASPPWPPTVGSSFGGSATCNGFTVDVKGKVTGTRDVAVGGASHRTFVLDSTLAFHGQIEGSGTQLDWADPATSLILHQENSMKGNYSGFVTFSSHDTSDIESTHPA